MECAFCGAEAERAAGCGLTLYAAPGVQVGRVWLSLCSNDILYVATLAREWHRPIPQPVRNWDINSVHNGEGRPVI
ncbi:MAG: hypothetical protein ACREP9_05130 [Candidatus Dormibacteraceae bacterium]